MKSKVCIILRKQSETGIAEDEVIISGKNEFFEKVKVFDKGVNEGEPLTLRDGEVFSPELDTTEPLKLECQHFLDSINNKTKPVSDGQNGLDVTKVMLEISPLK